MVFKFYLFILISLETSALAGLPVLDGKYHLNGLVQKCAHRPQAMCLTIHVKTYSQQIFEIQRSSYDGILKKLVGKFIDVDCDVRKSKIILTKAPRLKSNLGSPQDIFRDP